MKRLPFPFVLSALLTSTAAGCSEGQTPSQEQAPVVDPSPGSDTHPPSVGPWTTLAGHAEGSWMDAPAVVRAAAGASAEVSPAVRALIRRVHVGAGQAVEAGDPVLDVAAFDWSDAAAAYQGASNRLEIHTARSRELLALQERGLVGRADVFAEQAIVADLTAQRARAAATLRAAGISPVRSAQLAKRGVVTLRAPVAGIVTELNAHPGQIREPGGTPFARIQGEAEARVEVRTMQPWPAHARAHFASTEFQRFALSSAPLSRSVDPRDGTHVTWLSFADAALRLTDGLRGVVRVEPDPGTWRVPSTAVFVRDGQTFVRKRVPSGEAEVAVEVLGSDGALSWLRALRPAELDAGDRIATAGQPAPGTDGKPHPEAGQP